MSGRDSRGVKFQFAVVWFHIVRAAHEVVPQLVAKQRVSSKIDPMNFPRAGRWHVVLALPDGVLKFAVQAPIRSMLHKLVDCWFND